MGETIDAARPWAPCLVAALVLAALVLAGCGGGERPVDRATREGIFVIGNSDEPKGLDPQQVSGVLESNIIRALFEGLCLEHPTEDGVSLPGAAASWDTEDNQTWVFRLQPEGRWSDGMPVTSSDFRFAYRRILSPRMGADYAWFLYYLRGAEDFHRNRRSKILCRGDGELGVDWAAWDNPAEGLRDPFRGDGRLGGLGEVGMDALGEEELDGILAGRLSFPWPDEVPEAARETIVRRNLEFLRSGDELWDRAEVGVEAPDSHTLVLHLRSPIPFFTELTKHYTFFPVPEHLIRSFVDEAGEPRIDDPFLIHEWTRPGVMVSNGPFQLKSWRMNDHIEAERNPYYWDAEQVSLNGIRFLPVTNTYTEARMFFAGQLHMTYTLPLELLPLARERYGDEFRSEPYIGSRFLRCNVTRGPLDDPRVRMALSKAIDREKLIDLLFQDDRQPATGIVPPFGDYEAAGVVGYDPEGARALLAEAGYPEGRGFPSGVGFMTTDRDDARMFAEALDGMWRKELGIRVTIQQYEWKTYLGRMSNLDYDLCVAGWIGDYLDPSTFLDMWQTGGGDNRTGWGDPTFDLLIRQAEEETDPAARLAKMKEAELVLMEAQPVIPVHWFTTNYLLSRQVEGWSPLLLNNHPYKFVRLEVAP